MEHLCALSVDNGIEGQIEEERGRKEREGERERVANIYTYSNGMSVNLQVQK